MSEKYRLRFKIEKHSILIEVWQNGGIEREVRYNGVVIATANTDQEALDAAREQIEVLRKQQTGHSAV